jgi:hypothetical protein
MTLDEKFDGPKMAVDLPPELDPPATQLFAHMAKKKDIHPGDIIRVLSVVHDGVTYYLLQTSTSNIGIQVTIKSGLVLSLTMVQMEELQVMMFGS